MSPAQTMFALLDQFHQRALSLRQVRALYHLAAAPTQNSTTDLRHALGIDHRNGNFADELKRMTEAGILRVTRARNANNLPLHHYHLTPAGYKLIRILQPHRSTLPASNAAVC